MFKFGRVINVFFYTSNTEKLLQARLLFSRHGYQLRHFKGRNEPYDESYVAGTEALLRSAIAQVNAEFGIRSVFFVEDTSVRIEALSEENAFPGLRVKEWFSATTFAELNRAITLRGGDRRATVCSDIALYLPTLSRPLFFHGETCGVIALSAPSFNASSQYPWLTPSTFNGWFIPNGATKRLGEMEFEESLAFDFRAKSIAALIERLEELNAALNVPAQFYTLRKRDKPQGAQLSFISEQTQDVLLVIGHKCAGKTTFADRVVATREGASIFEASTVLRGIANGGGDSVKTDEEALSFLRHSGMDIVAAQIADYIESNATPLNVVTGLRTIEELLFLRRRFPQSKIIFIDADPRVRFERHIRRARNQDAKTFKEFALIDEKQARFGALRVAAEICHRVITNDGTMDQYLRRVDELLGSPFLSEKSSISISEQRPKGELHRCLFALARLNRVASCDEIAENTAKSGVGVRRYNTNRALKAVPEFAERVQKSGRLLSYRITNQGRTLLTLLDGKG